MITPRNPLGRSSSPDDDPTGVRALLSSLPDPGPMPPDLVDRITASLAQEQRARAGAGATTGATEARGGPGADGERPAYGSVEEAGVTPLVRRRRRRQVLSGIAGAAAAVVVGWAGVTAYVNQQGTGASAGSAVGAAQSGSEQSGAGSTAGGGSGGGSGGKALQHGQGIGPDEAKLSAVTVRQSGRNYRAATFAQQAATLAATAAKKPSLSGSGPHAEQHAEKNGGGRLGTTAGVTDCLEGLGVHPTAARPAVADLARYAGKPAVVLVVTSGAGSAEQERAWAVGRDCSASDPHLLHGPVRLR